MWAAWTSGGRRCRRWRPRCPWGSRLAGSASRCITGGRPALALKVESLQGIVDLGAAEVFQLPARTLLPQPPPFTAALVHAGSLALELSVPALGWVPIEPAIELEGPPPELGFPTPREVLFARAGATYAVPVQLLARVLERPRVFTVPLTPSAHRGLLYHERAIHPVIDLEVLYGGSPAGPAAFALLVEAGTSAVAVLADRMLPAGSFGEEPRRPSWEGLFEEPR